MRVTVIICTRNRASSLSDTIKSLCKVEIPKGWKADLLIVDNGSTDTTRNVVEKTVFAGRRARYLPEQTLGVASARNSALLAAEGEFLLWTDDDVRLPAEWMSGMIKPLVDGRMDAVAGGVRLAFGRDRYWMGTCLRSWLASTEGLFPDRPGRMIGANMAFHRRVLEAAPRFDVALGPGALGMGEETLFSYQLVAGGFRLGSAFEVQVEHTFDTGRLCPRGLQDVARSMGRSEAYIAHHWHGINSSDVLIKNFEAKLRLAYWRVRARLQNRVPPGLLEKELQAFSALHYWQYLRTISRSPRRYCQEETKGGAVQPEKSKEVLEPRWSR